MPKDMQDSLSSWLKHSGYVLEMTVARGLRAAANDAGIPTCTGLSTYEKSVYDGNGNRTSLRTRKGDVIGYHFDAMNRQDMKSPASQGAVTTGLNLMGEPLLISKALMGTAPAHTTSYTYDAKGRELTETNDGLTVTHQYDTVLTANDNGGNRTRTVWPDGYYVSYQYDALNRMVDARENSTSTNELAFYSYDSLSRRSSVCLGAYTSTACQTGTWTNKAAYAYDAVTGQLSGLTHTFNATTMSLGYGRNHAYQINGLTATDSFYLPGPTTASTVAYVPNALDGYNSIGGNTTSYDLNGNLLTWVPSNGKATYTYDSENRLTTAAVQGSTSPSISYDYDGLGRRVSKTVSGVTTKYSHDGNEEIAEYAGATLLRRYVTGPGVDDRIAHVEGAAVTNPTKTYYHTNHQGSVIAVTDGSGTVAQRVGYDEYGTGAPASGEPFGYTGRRYDPESGLYYYRARYYSPAMGRFLQADPVGYKDDLNLYAYVGNDPLNKSDPSGESGCADLNWDNVGKNQTCVDADDFRTTDKKFLVIFKLKANAIETDAVGTEATDAAAAAFSKATNQQTGNEQVVRIDTAKAVDGKDTATVTPVKTTLATPSEAHFSPQEVKGANAVDHTHPTKDDYLQPGTGDWVVPVQLHLPNYISHGERTVVVEVSGGQVRIRVVSGSITSAERSQIQQRANEFQRHGGIH